MSPGNCLLTSGGSHTVSRRCSVRFASVMSDGSEEVIVVGESIKISMP